MLALRMQRNSDSPDCVQLIRMAGAIPILLEFLKNADPSVGLTPPQSLALMVRAEYCYCLIALIFHCVGPCHSCAQRA